MQFRTLQKLTAADLLDLQRLTETWETYTVAWTSGGTQPVIGNGILEGRKQVVGKWRRNYIRMVAGSTTTFGTGQYFWSLSDTAVRQHSAPMYIFDSGTANRSALGVISSGLTTLFGVTSADTDVSATVPQTWANSDMMICQIDYEVA
jgi:hypothetical protein